MKAKLVKVTIVTDDPEYPLVRSKIDVMMVASDATE